jgi:hypothetical protein
LHSFKFIKPINDMKTKLIGFVGIILLVVACAKEEIPLESIKLSSNSINLKVGESLNLTANVEPVNTTEAGLSWISRDESVVSVSTSGNINGVGFGKTYVVVSSAGNIADSAEIFVNGTLSGVSGSETLTLGSTYANDVYYSLTKGVVATVPRTNWDIAFQTGSRSSTIIINGGAGIKLYKFPGGDINAWANVNTAGIAGWPVLNNSDTTWSLGAFERNSLGHPDYGWGIYNSVTHDVVGDSLFVIQLKDLTYRKLWIKKKVSVENKYIFQFANIDGSGSVTDTVNCAPYTGKNFIYYSFASKDVVDREPAKDNWDFVVTKYLEMIPDGSGGKVPYPVIGVLTNTGVRSAQLDNVPVTTTDYSAVKFITPISEIGSDWKSFNMSTNQWSIAGNRVYFVRNTSLSVFKLVFTGFEGSSTGVIRFDKSKLN